MWSHSQAVCTLNLFLNNDICSSIGYIMKKVSSHTSTQTVIHNRIMRRWNAEYCFWSFGPRLNLSPILCSICLSLAAKNIQNSVRTHSTQITMVRCIIAMAYNSMSMRMNRYSHTFFQKDQTQMHWQRDYYSYYFSFQFKKDRLNTSLPDSQTIQD